MKEIYQRDLGHNYMILQEEEKGHKEDFRVKMLMYNEIGSVLAYSIRMMNSSCHYYYDITSKQTMQRMFERRQIQYKDLKQILLGFLSMIQSVKEYMLDMNHFILEEPYIYMNMETEAVYFCYFPGYRQSVKESFHKLTEYFLNRVDHTDQKAVVAAYELFRQTMEDNYDLEQIIRAMFEKDGKESHIGEVQSACVDAKAADIHLKEQTFSSPSHEPAQTIQKVPTKEASKIAAKAPKKSLSSVLDKQNNNQKKRLHKGKDPVTGKPKVLLFGVAGIVILAEAGSLCLFILLLVSKSLQARFPGDTYMKVMVGLLVEMALLFYALYRCYEKCVGKPSVEESEFVLEKSEQDFNREFTAKQEGCHYGDSFLQQEVNPPFFAGKAEEPSDSKNTKELGYGDTVLLSYQAKPVGKRLISTNGHTKDFALNQASFIIGKMEQCVDGLILDESVSRIHAEIKKEEEKFFLIDLNSTNGTFLNGKRLETNEKVLLKEKDQIRFATTEFIFQS